MPRPKPFMVTAAAVMTLVLASSACRDSSPRLAAVPTGSVAAVVAPTETSREEDPALIATRGPGSAVLDSLVVEGTTVSFILLLPPDFSAGDTAPVLVAFPPGAQDVTTAQSSMERIYRSEAAARGWVVLVPIAPDGTSYFSGAERYVPALVDRVRALADPEGGRVHFAGPSNGGISAFRAAARSPELTASVTVFPGYPRSAEDLAALEELTDVPISLFAGGDDEEWVARSEETAARLSSLGASYRYTSLPGEGHVPSSLWETSTELWDTLDAAR